MVGSDISNADIKFVTKTDTHRQKIQRQRKNGKEGDFHHL